MHVCVRACGPRCMCLRVKNVENPCVLPQRAAVNSSACLSPFLANSENCIRNAINQRKIWTICWKISDSVLVFCAAQGFACDIFGYVCARRCFGSCSCAEKPKNKHAEDAAELKAMKNNKKTTTHKKKNAWSEKKLRQIFQIWILYRVPGSEITALRSLRAIGPWITDGTNDGVVV